MQSFISITIQMSYFIGGCAQTITCLSEKLNSSVFLLLIMKLKLSAVLWPLHVYQQKHPLNFVFLGLFTLSLSLTVGVSCANTDGWYRYPHILMLQLYVIGLSPANKSRHLIMFSIGTIC